MHFVYAGSLLLAPLSYAELPLGIPIKNCNDQKIESNMVKCPKNLLHDWG